MSLSLRQTSEIWYLSLNSLDDDDVVVCLSDAVTEHRCQARSQDFT